MTADDGELITLRARVLRLERLFFGAYGVLIALLLVLGLILPFLVEHAGDEDETPWSVLGFVFQPLVFDADDDWLAFGITMLIGFIGLIVVTLLIIVITLPAAALGTMTDRGRVFGRVLATLGIIGAVVVLLFGLISLRSDSNAFGLGGLLLFIGMLGVLPLLVQGARPRVESGRPRQR